MRLDARDMGKLVDEAFVEEGGVAVRARAPVADRHADLGRVVVHRERRDRIGGHRPLHRQRVAALRQQHGRAGGGVVGKQALGKRVTDRGGRDLAQPARHPATLCQPRRHAGGGRRAVAIMQAGLAARPGQLHGLFQAPGQKRCLLGDLMLQVRAEAAAGDRRVQHDALLADAERPRRRGACERRRLGGHPQRQPPIPPGGGGGGWLDRGMQGRPHAIVGGDDLCILEGRGEIADARHAGTLAIERGVECGVDRLAVHQRAARLEPGGEPIERSISGPPGLSYGGDPVRVLHHCGDAAHAIGRRTVHAYQPAVADRPLADGREHHAGQADVAREIGAAVDLGGRVEAGQRLPGQPLLLAGAQRQVAARQPLVGRIRRKRAEPLTLPARDHEAVEGGAAVPVHVPAARRRLAQQDPGRSPGLAQFALERADRGGGGGEHQRLRLGVTAAHPFGQVAQRILEQHRCREPVGIERVDRCRLDRDGAPVRAQFVGDDLRQGGEHALSQLRLRHRDGHLPVCADLDPGAEDRLPLGRRQVDGVVAWPKRPADHQPHPRRAADQQPAPGHSRCRRGRARHCIQSHGRRSIARRKPAPAGLRFRAWVFGASGVPAAQRLPEPST